ncbi:MAG: leucine-rich repeat protein [Lachnospiraceae bacterium]|nr:leucine-rich repeat protein [Lachnospiraceae bacterium]
MQKGRLKRLLAGLMSFMMVMTGVPETALVYAAEDVIVDEASEQAEPTEQAVASESDSAGQAVEASAPESAPDSEKDSAPAATDSAADEGEDSAIEESRESEEMPVSDTEEEAVVDEGNDGAGEADVDGDDIVADSVSDFEITDTGVLTGLKKAGATVIVIPASVTSIAKEVFRADKAANSVIKSVSAATGSKLRSINEAAFYNCGVVTTIDLSNCSELTTIDKNAFYGCEKLTSLTLPENLNHIRGGAFTNCKSLTTLTLPEQLVAIGASAFTSAKALKTVTVKCISLPDGSVGKGAISGTEALTTVTFTDGVKNIPGNLFANAGFIKTTPYGVVNIPASAESIGESAFDTAKNLKTVNIASGSKLVRIEKNAFKGCFKETGWEACLEDINGMPSSGITFIGEGAFYGDAMLNQFDLSSDLTSIGKNAFRGCVRFTSAVIPDGVTNYTLGEGAFCATGLTTVTLPKDLTYLPANVFNGCLFNEGHWNWNNGKITALDSGCLASNMFVNLVIPDYITECGEGVFAGNKLMTSVTIGTGITNINKEMFKGCTSLKSVTIPAHIVNPTPEKAGTVTYGIATSAFEGCGLQTLTFAERTAPLNIGPSAFKDNKTLATVNFTENIERIGNSAFEGCRDLITYTLPNSLATIGECAFKSNEAVEAVTLPVNVTSIGKEAFHGDARLATVTVNCAGLETCGQNIFTGCTLGKIDLSDKLTAIPDNMFYMAGYVTNAEINIPASVTTIGSKAFAGTSASTVNLKTVKFDDGCKVREIGEQAFAYCTSLTDIDFSDSLEVIGKQAFLSDTALTSFDVPAGVLTIRAGAFSGCTHISHLFLPSTVNLIEANAFDEIPSTAFRTGIGTYAYNWLTANHQFYNDATITDGVKTITYHLIYDNLAFNHAKNSECYEPEHDDMTLYDASLPGYNCLGWYDTESPSGGHRITSTDGRTGDIEVWARYEEKTPDETLFTWDKRDPTIITGLSDKGKESSWIIIPAKTTAIAFKAFKDDVKLTSVAFAEGCAITIINENAFEGCTGLSVLDMRRCNHLKTIGKEAFKGTSLRNVLFNEALEHIETKAFMNCNLLGEVTFEKGMRWLGASAFEGCGNLSQVIIKSNNMAMESTSSTSTSGSTTTLTNSIAGRAFYKCNLSSIKTEGHADQGETAYIIPAGLFYGATFASDTHLVLPNTIKDVGYAAFAQAQNLAEVSFEGNTNDVDIKDYAFYNVFHLENITLPAKLKTIGESGLAANPLLTSITVPATVTSIGKNAFASNDLITTLTIPANVDTLGAGVCSECGKLQTLKIISTKVKSIPDKTCYKCVTLENVEYGEDIETIGESAFEGCTSLHDFYFENGLTAIGKKAFKDCEILSAAELTDKITLVDDYAFAGCVGLATLSLPAELVTIGSHAFDGDAKIKGFAIPDVNDSEDDAKVKTATLPGKLETIGSFAFNGCEKITGLIFPAALTSIGESAFVGCTGLTKADLDKCTELTEIGKNAFKGCADMEGANLANSGKLTKIGASAFEGCESIDIVTIPVSVTEIGDSAYKNAYGVRDIIFNAKTLTKAGTAGSTGAKRYSAAKPVFDGCVVLSTFTIGDEVTAIPDALLYKANFSKPVAVKIPAGVKSIGAAAFAGTQNGDSITNIKISSVTFESDNTLLTIGDEAFRNSLIKGFDMPKSVNKLGKYALADAVSLEDATLSPLLTELPEGTFLNDSSLLSVFFKGSKMKTIGGFAFTKCIHLISFNVPASVTKIDGSAFAWCYDLKVLYIPPSVVTWPSTDNDDTNVFNGDMQLTVVTPKYYPSTSTTETKAWTYCTTVLGEDRVTSENLSTITYVLGDKNAKNPGAPTIYYEKGSPVYFPDPELKNFKFVGWYKDEAKTQKIESTEGCTGDITIYADWTLDWDSIKYTVTFDKNLKAASAIPKEKASVSVTGSDPVTMLTEEDVKAEGYELLGWSTVKEPTEENPGVMYKPGDVKTRLATKSGDKVVLYGQWKGKTYNIQYELPKGTSNSSDNPSTYNVSEKAVPLTDPTVPSKAKFEGWAAMINGVYKTGLKTIPAGSSGDLTFYAIVSYSNNNYTVKLNANGGKLAKGVAGSISAHTKNGFYLPMKGAVEKEGYTFKGWAKTAKAKKPLYSYEDVAYKYISKNLSSKSEDEEKAGDVTLYAVWGPLEYNTTVEMYNLTVSSDGFYYFAEDPKDPTIGGGYYTAKQMKSVNKKKTHTAAKKLKLVKPKKVGYRFKEWLITDVEGKELARNKSYVPKGIAGDVVVTPIWIENTYIITYYGNKGTVNGKKSYKDPVVHNFRDLVTTLDGTQVESKEGKTLAGWSFKKKDTVPTIKAGQGVEKLPALEPKIKQAFKKKGKLKLYAIWN